MMRHIVRRVRGSNLIVLVAAMFVASSGMPPVLAQGEQEPEGGTLGEGLSGQGPVMSLGLLHPPRAGQTVPRPPTPNEIEQLRHQLTAQRESKNPRVAERAVRALRWVDILTAKTAAERHEKIRELPVTVVLSTSPDGESGIVKKFVVRGKARIQWSIPGPRPSLVKDDQVPGPGPYVPAGTGRWKLDGAGNCYWDAEDDGPNQCWPETGRFKLDGSGNCYWEPNDGGPDQCEPPETVCFYEGQPDECATQQEIEDAMILAAAAEDEAAMLEAEADADWAEIEDYCYQHPWECGGPATSVGGPSDRAPCSAEFDNFVGAALSTNGAIIALVAVATAPVSALVVAGGAVAVVGGLFWMRSAGTDLYNCKAALVY